MFAQIPTISPTLLIQWILSLCAFCVMILLFAKVSALIRGKPINGVSHSDFNALEKRMDASDIKWSTQEKRVDDMQRALSAGAEARQEKLLLYLEKFLEKKYRR